MSPLRKILGVSLVATVLVGGGMLAAQPDNPGDAPADSTGDTPANEAPPSPEIMRSTSAAVIEQLRGQLERFVELRKLARESGDILKLNCVNDKMLLYKQVVNLAEDARAEMVEGLGEDDDARRDRGYAQVADAGRRGAGLRQAAEACIGAELMFVGPRLDVDSPPVDDLDAYDWFDLDDPKYATPFN